MQVVERSINDIIPYSNNPRINNDAIDPVAESIKSFGWKQPIVVDRNNTIVCGHTRYQAAIKLGLETVPCVVADDLSPDEVRAYRLVDNKTAEYSLWDTDKLMKEIESIEFDLTQYSDWESSEMSNYSVDDIPDTPREIHYTEKFGVVIDCRDEPEQRKAFEFVTGGGYSARIVSI